MINKKVVIALGGNALGKTPLEQRKIVKETAKGIVDLATHGNRIIVTHGNGPQIGLINNALKDVPFPECGAMSQGYIGYDLQQAIQNELKKRKKRRSCVTIITQVMVNPNDLAFKNPTKPIGEFYTKEEAKKISKDFNYTFKEDAGRGYRRVVPSPLPMKVLELNIIKKISQQGSIVITCGGGGIPVIKTDNGYEGIDAVIDKDMSSAKLAIDMNADVLLILTAVDGVYENYNTENQKLIKEMTVMEAQQRIDNNQFSEGSMLPKVEACNWFVTNTQHGKAIITSIANSKRALQGKKDAKGTIIKR
jgi:carbamate kinase